jgi:integrase
MSLSRNTNKVEKREALVVLRRAETKVADGQREGPAVNRTRFEDLIEGLKNDYIVKRLKTWKLREQHLAHLKPVFGGMRAKAITTPNLQAYVAKRLDEGAAPYHIQVAATIGYYTGMRKGEILSLEWEKHIDMEQHCIRLERKQTKTNTSRGLYMEGDFLKVMLKAKEVRDREYPTCPWVVYLKGQRVKSFDHGWTALMKRLSMPGVLFHDLRRTGVRNLVRAGVPETVAMKISGHKTRSVFDRYNITSEEDLKEAAIRLDAYIQGEKITLPVTPEGAPGSDDSDTDAQPIDNWRRGWGSNPRSRCQDSSFRDCPIRPLSHLSAGSSG